MFKPLSLAFIFSSIFTFYCQAEGPPPAAVHVDEVKNMEVAPSVWRTGFVISRNDALVSARSTGQIIALLEEGDEVFKGDVLFQVDDSQLKLQLSQQKAKLRQQQANVTFLGNEVERLKRLVKTKTSSLTDLERSQSAHDVAKAALDAEKSRLAQIEKTISYARLTSPFTGMVTERVAQVGSVVTPGDPVLRLVDLLNKDISLSVPLSSWPYVKKGMSLRVSSELGEQELKVRQAVPVGNKAGRLMQVLLEASNLDWPVGLDVKVALPLLDVNEGGLLIPRDALILRRGGNAVFKLDENLIAKKVNVTESVGIDAYILVDGDLSPGDKVVIRGAERLRDGMKVTIKQDNSNLVTLRKDKMKQGQTDNMSSARSNTSAEKGNKS